MKTPSVIFKMQFALTVAFIFFVSNAFATIRTVYNSVPNPGQFSTLQNAYNASSPGDTIYLLPSPTIYTGIVISKKIAIIGGGYATEKPGAFSTSISNFTFGAGCEGSVITGLYITGAVNFTALTTYNVTISRCYFPSSSPIVFNLSSGNLQNIQYNECFFDNMYIEVSSSGNITTQANVVFNNCVARLLNSNIAFITQNGAINSTALINWNFNQCLFYGFNNGSNTTSPLYKYGWGGTFAGCIFNKVNLNSITGAVFTNCLTYNCNTNNIWDVNGNLNLSTVGTNIVNQDPQFSTTNVQTGNANPFGGHDYFRMNNTSPTRIANHSGATYEIGPFGGNGNFNFIYSVAPGIPIVHPVVAITPTVQSGQNLQIEVIGKKHN